MNHKLGMRVGEPQQDSRVAEIILDVGAPGGRRIDQQAVGDDALQRQLPWSQMHDVLRLRDRLPVTIRRAMTDRIFHAGCRDRALTQRGSFSIMLK